MAALKVVILTSSGAASDENFIKMTFPFQRFNDFPWVLWHLKSQAAHPFVEQFAQANYKGPYYWPFLWGKPLVAVDSPHKEPMMRKARACQDATMTNLFR